MQLQEPGFSKDSLSEANIQILKLMRRKLDSEIFVAINIDPD